MYGNIRNEKSCFFFFIFAQFLIEVILRCNITSTVIENLKKKKRRKLKEENIVSKDRTKTFTKIVATNFYI